MPGSRAPASQTRCLKAILTALRSRHPQTYEQHIRREVESHAAAALRLLKLHPQRDESLRLEVDLVRTFQAEDLARLIRRRDIEVESFDDLSRQAHLLGIGRCQLARSGP